MNALLITHIAGGSLAILSGTAGPSQFAKAGRTIHWLADCSSARCSLLGSTATLLALSLPIPDLSRATGGTFAVYLVATSWAAARWRKGNTGLFEVWACAAILSLGVAFVGLAIAASRSASGSFAQTGATSYFMFAAVCALFGALDLNVILRPISRKVPHCAPPVADVLAFFFATGSFFLRQQKVMPAAVHGSLILWALGLAPLAIMLVWLVRLRLPKSMNRLRVALPGFSPLWPINEEFDHASTPFPAPLRQRILRPATSAIDSGSAPPVSNDDRHRLDGSSTVGCEHGRRHTVADLRTDCCRRCNSDVRTRRAVLFSRECARVARPVSPLPVDGPAHYL